MCSTFRLRNSDLTRAFRTSYFSVESTHMKRKTIGLIFLLSLTAAAGAQTTPTPTPLPTASPTPVQRPAQTILDLQAKIRSRLLAPELRRGQVGIKIVSLSSGKVIF